MDTATATATAIPEEKPLVYSQVRASIQDGDIILFQGARKLSRAIRRVAHSAYSHVGLVLTWYGRRVLLSAEMPKVQALPLGLAVVGYRGRVDWYRLTPAARAALDIDRLALEALSNLGVEYGATTLLSLAAHYSLGLPPKDDAEEAGEATPHTMVCSEYVSRCFRKAGLDLSSRSDVETDPGEIARSPHIEFVGTLQRELESVEQARSEKAL